MLYLPKYSYFGDFQILLELKSNMEYKTPPVPKETENEHVHKFIDNMPDIQLMCVSKEKLLQLCDLFPQTAENIKQRARERRIRFMEQKNIKSISYNKKKDEIMKQFSEQSPNDPVLRQKLASISETFYSDEEPESLATNKEDMKLFLNKMNTRIDLLVETLKEADSMICKQQ